MTLVNALEGTTYVIKEIETGDDELESFLFSLGCYSGEEITVVSHLKRGVVFLLKTRAII